MAQSFSRLCFATAGSRAHHQGVPFTVTGSPVVSMLPTLGSHKYNNIAYEDLVFGLE